MSRYSTHDIARYAEGDMDETERLQFSQALTTDKELEQELNYYRNIQSSLRMKLIEDENDQAFKAPLKAHGKNHFIKEAKVIPIKRILTWSAAAAVFVLFLIWAPWNSNLYDQYATTEMLATAERGVDQTGQKMQEAANAFNKKDFEQAKSLLQNIVQSEPENSLAQYYYGISLMQSGEITKSREVLLKLFKDESILKYDAAFYIALTHLKEKDNGQTIVWLNKIPEDANTYTKAQKLLQELD